MESMVQARSAAGNISAHARNINGVRHTLSGRSGKDATRAYLSTGTHLEAIRLLNNNRGIFTTGPDGRYAFRGIKPVSYAIPDDGPVGQLLRRLGRHPFRPAHMHFIVSAVGFDPVVTHTFVAGDPYLDSDAVFGVKTSLIVEYQEVADSDTKWRSEFDFVLNRA